MNNLRDDEFFENERPRIKENLKIRICKTKAVIKDEYDPDDNELEIQKKKDGIEFKFTSKQEYTCEDVEECDLGHKHRVIKTKDFAYETVRLDRRSAKILLAWFAGEEFD